MNYPYNCLLVSEACAAMSVYQGTPIAPSPIPIEDVRVCFETTTALLGLVLKLEQEHKKYIKMKQNQTEPGSK